MTRLDGVLARLRLWHILALFAALATWSSIVVPLGEGPDELPHFTIIRYIVRNGHRPATPNEHEAFQPPLYYFISAGLTFWINTDDFVIKANADYDPVAPDAPKTLLLHTRAEAFPYQGWALAWHLMRLTSVLMGVVTVTAIYATALALSGERPFALAAAVCTAFLPGFIYMSAVVNNDDLATMFAALLCWQSVSLLLSCARLTARRAAAIGLLLGLGFLSKTSMLAFAALVAPAFAAAAWLHSGRFIAGARASLIAYVVAVAVSFWYFVDNIAAFGDWLGWPLVLSANAVRTQQLDLGGWLSALAQVYRSFWLEWIGIALPAPLLAIVSVFAVLAALGLLLRVARMPRDWRVLARSPRWMAVAWLAVLAAIIAASWIRWTQTVLGTEQARLFYPALSPLVLALVFGLRAVHRRLPWVLAGVLCVLAVIAPPLFFAPAYAPAPRIAALPPGAQSISATFKDKLRLIGWDVSAKRARPGDVLKIGLYWESLKDLTDDDWLKIQLLDAGDRFVAFKDGSPSAGRDSTDSWRRGERIASLHRLAMPPDLRPGVYRLTVGIHPYGRKNWFPIDEENMWIALSDQLVLTEISVE
ncbi:MAG: glycosyltransferase family 39 protein [Chloroflexi bacterium]|nr:glycosyltransferase family 39 protein [Chloroflexota bacterium]